MTPSGSIERPWGATVFGAASVTAEPDLARLQLAIRQTRSTPGEAFEAARGLVSQVRQVLGAHDIPDTAVSASRLQLRSSTSFDGTEPRLLGYECAASFIIELRDLDSLEALLVELVDAGANHVDGIEFDTSSKQELRAQVQQAAVAAARAKAELYARAAAVRLGPVTHIEDVDAERPQVAGQALMAVSRDRGLVPGRITVSAAVVMGFSLIGD